MEPGEDFLSTYVSHSDSQTYMKSQASSLSFSPSPTKYNSILHDITINGFTDFNMNGRQFCHANNIKDCVQHLNQELTSLGLSSLFEEGQTRYSPVCLINCTYELLEQYQKSGRSREQLEDRAHRLESDLNHTRETENRLVRELSQSQQETVQAEERERQFTVKNKHLTVKLKAEKEEVKRLQSVLQHRDQQFKHEVKKKELENHKLRERMHQMLTDRKSGKVGMTISNVLQRPGGSRGTWSGNKQEEELFRCVISNYEEKVKELMVENSGLRHCLHDIQHELLAEKTSSEDSSERLSEIFDVTEDNALRNGHSTPNPKGILQMPLEYLEGNLLTTLNDRCHHLRKYIRNLEKQISGSSTSSKTEQGTSPPKTYIRSPSKEDRRNEKDVTKLMADIKHYKDIVEQQEQFIHDTMSRKSLDGASFLNESELVEEKEKLEMQRKLFEEQKANFQKERNAFTESTLRLHREKKKFDDLKAAFLKDQFLQITPFHSKQSSRQSNASLLKQTTKRKLPLAPTSVVETPNIPESLSPISEGCDTPEKQQLGPVSTPTTIDLYKFLGITGDNKHNQNRARSADLSLGQTPSILFSQQNYSPPWASSGPRRCTSAINKTRTPHDHYKDEKHKMSDVKTLLFEQQDKGWDLSEEKD